MRVDTLKKALKFEKMLFKKPGDMLFGRKTVRARDFSTPERHFDLSGWAPGALPAPPGHRKSSRSVQNNL
jgi:hypothetical protein